MIQRPLSLVVSILLAVMPVLPAGAAMRESKAAPALPQAAVTAPVQTPVVSLPAMSAIGQVELGTPGALNALAADVSPAAAAIKTVAVRPELLSDASVRAQAVAVLGETAVARLEAAAAALPAKAAADPSVAAAVAAIRSQTSAVTPSKAQNAAARLIKEFGTMERGDAVTASEAAPMPRLAKPTFMTKVRRAAAAVMIAASLSAPGAAVAQDAQHMLPVPPQIVLAQAGQNQQAGAVLEARDINEAIRNYGADTKVIVVGRPQIDQATLRAIARELKDKSWIVVIVDDASGARYTDAEGRTHYDLDAIDFGTGQGLYNNGAMKVFTHPQTGERTSVVFTIVMQQHKFYLHGSDAMRNHGLDTPNGREFKGDLDQWAISHMRNGGDVQGAVSETVANVDALLARAIANDAATGQEAVAAAKSSVDELAKARAAFVKAHPGASQVGRADVEAMRRSVAEGERLLSAKKPKQAAQTVAETRRQADAALSDIRSYEQALASAGAELAQAKTEIDAADAAAAAFRAKHAKAAGDLARPAVANWRETLAAAQAQAEKDPRAAVATAKDLTSKARAHAQGLAELAGAADQLSAAQSLHDRLAERSRAGSAQEQLTAAQQSLRDARELAGNADASWKARADEAKIQLAAAEQSIDAADAAAHRNALIFWLLMALASAFTLGTAIVLNRRAARAWARAEAELKKWDDILEKKLDAIIDQLDSRMDVYVGPETGEKSRGWVEDTAALTAQIRRDSGYAKLLLAKARQVHDESTALVRPKRMSARWVFNQFWPSNFALAERKLADLPIVFSRDDSLDEIFGQGKKDWRDDLYGDVKQYEPFSKTFSELMKEFNDRSKAAVESLDKLEHAVTQSGEIMNALDAAVAKTAKTKDSLAAADKLFAAAPVYDAALPAVTAMVAQARENAKKNPILAVYGGAAEAQRIVDDASALVKTITEARASSLKTADADASKLEDLTVATGWIAAEKARLSAEADAIAAASAKAKVADRVAKLAESLGTLAHRADDARKGAEALAQARKDIAAATQGVSEARATLGQTLGLPAEKMMTEEGLNPTDALARATKAADLTQKLLGEGRLDDAKASYDDLQKNLKQATGITAASLDSLKTHAQVEQTRRAETERLQGLVPQRASVLQSIEREFADSVLSLTAGDASHPNANGTVKDNVDEADAAIEAATAKRAKALKVFKQGSVLEAADLLAQALAHQQIAQHRLDEITEKRKRLDEAVAANAALRGKLEARVKEYERSVVDDARTMKATLDAFAASKTQLAAAIKQVEAQRPDPFVAGAALAKLSGALDQVWVSARNDFDAFAEVERSLKAARAQLDEAARQAQAAKGDGVADSPMITKAYGDIGRLETSYNAAVNAAKRPHGDWPSADKEADRITSEAAHVAAVLRDELAAAARATQAISRGASKVREATNWSGSYGVYIPGSPGSGSLDSARSALSRGDYAAAVQYAESAYREADYAIDQAEAEVMRRRREEEERRRREEEERRRRQQEEEDRRRRSSDSGSSGSSGSGWGGSSSGNSSSGW